MFDFTTYSFDYILAYETGNLKDINGHYNEVQRHNQNAILAGIVIRH